MTKETVFAIGVGFVLIIAILNIIDIFKKYMKSDEVPTSSYPSFTPQIVANILYLVLTVLVGLIYLKLG